jgi:hypothetical protein
MHANAVARIIRRSVPKVTNEQRFPAVPETPTRLARSGSTLGLTRVLVIQERA